ncbi:30S ribosomal protein S21 [Patescibacteria group bacterium]|nr:30S ribosomal protein S21 [Patescibacteria group bacterium]
MTVNIQVNKQNNENTVGIIRRFTKRVQGSGILRRARSVRYFDRPLSKLLRKRKALKSISKKEILEELIKLGKIERHSPFHRRSRR